MNPITIGDAIGKVIFAVGIIAVVLVAAAAFMIFVSRRK